MPNLQSLGINPNGQNGPPNQGKDTRSPIRCLNEPSTNSRHLITGMNMNPLPISPAIVAALNQWGLIGNMNQNQNPDQVTDNHTNKNNSMRRKRRL